MMDEGGHVGQNFPQRDRGRDAESSEIGQEGVPELGPSLPEHSKVALFQRQVLQLAQQAVGAVLGGTCLGC
eukprot:88921-Pyramimonas_sp.AAC.1